MNLTMTKEFKAALFKGLVSNIITDDQDMDGTFKVSLNGLQIKLADGRVEVSFKHDDLAISVIEHPLSVRDVLTINFDDAIQGSLKFKLD